METPTLPPAAMEDLYRYLDEYGWNAALAARLLRRRYGVELQPLDVEYLFAVERRRRAYA